ncbi:TPA: ead/Ea22-like family protein [Raoultella ornithinolytica]|uniref:ead/Ea22-like family protein n=1 Tax=Raoultella ornithinolytica TaxID=54291 RepID=UPI0028551FBA|nr:ead/Ea22-like family protein [Raoultella ornithinolytica]HDV8371038.1 ead/Ea22-like family protein [Raoultella ornithinolytica]HEC2546620.1 ead/Ea22-like family protein [Raoultella ornithinolytica]
MTTDITELAQSLKAAADREMICRDVAETSEIWERTVTPENILALVEALEKAQQYAKERDAENQDLMLTVGRLRVEREELESRTVKLPKPRAHLIWIQAGHAPDDYWDDVAVSHSEKDRCCDGSERYPVYARWEIEEMLAAAGIKVEAE